MRSRVTLAPPRRRHFNTALTDWRFHGVTHWIVSDSFHSVSCLWYLIHLVCLNHGLLGEVVAPSRYTQHQSQCKEVRGVELKFIFSNWIPSDRASLTGGRHTALIKRTWIYCVSEATWVNSGWTTGGRSRDAWWPWLWLHPRPSETCSCRRWIRSLSFCLYRCC